MKLNIKGLVFVGFAAAVFASAANADLPAAADQPKTVTSVKFTEATYQKKLTAGTNVNISNDNVITATDTTYSAGTGIDISDQNVISVDENDLTQYAAGDNVQFTAGTGDNVGKTVISATDTTYNAFNGSANGLVPATGAAAGKVLSGDGSWVTVDGTPYTAGTNIQINDHQISATDTTYTAGTGITISGANNAIAVDGDITPYTAGTNVQISGHQISATDTTYAAGTHVTISGDNNAINVADNGTISANDTGLVTGQTVYNYVTGLVPATLPNTCTTAAPCAMVLANGTVSWEPIQQ